MLTTLVGDNKLKREENNQKGTLERSKKKKLQKKFSLEKRSLCNPGEKHPEQMLWQEEEGGSREAESGLVRERRVGQVKEASPLAALQARSWVWLPTGSSASRAVCWES